MRVGAPKSAAAVVVGRLAARCRLPVADSAGVISGTDGKASKSAWSKRGDGREPAEDIDVQEDGRVSSLVIWGNISESPDTSWASAVIKNADGVMVGSGGTTSLGIGGRREERAREVDLFGG